MNKTPMKKQKIFMVNLKIFMVVLIDIKGRRFYYHEKIDYDKGDNAGSIIICTDIKQAAKMEYFPAREALEACRKKANQFIEKINITTTLIEREYYRDYEREATSAEAFSGNCDRLKIREI